MDGSPSNGSGLPVGSRGARGGRWAARRDLHGSLRRRTRGRQYVVRGIALLAQARVGATSRPVSPIGGGSWAATCLRSPPPGSAEESIGLPLAGSWGATICRIFPRWLDRFSRDTLCDVRPRSRGGELSRTAAFYAACVDRRTRAASHTTVRASCALRRRRKSTCYHRGMLTLSSTVREADALADQIAELSAHLALHSKTVRRRFNGSPAEGVRPLLWVAAATLRAPVGPFAASCGSLAEAAIPPGSRVRCGAAVSSRS